MSAAPPKQEGLPDEADGLALAVHRVDEVEAVVAGHAGVDALADDDRRDGVAALVDRRHLEVLAVARTRYAEQLSRSTIVGRFSGGAQRTAAAR